jgi:tRNA threonylcarbamoyladenosine biosynthesis protein TsaB
MSIILGIDTSSTDLSIGLYRDAAPIASYSRYIGNSHAEHIAPALRMMLGGNGIEPDTVDRIAVAVGPGSFTGLRIGIAFVKGFCVAHPIRVLPVSSLLILAHAAGYHHGRIVAAIDARNGDVFWAAFSRNGSALQRLTEDIVSPGEPFSAALTPEDIVVTDTIGYKKSTVFSALPVNCVTVPVEFNFLQRGLLCAAHAAAEINNPSVWCKPVDIHPNYLRRSAPEERQAAAGRR